MRRSSAKRCVAWAAVAGVPALMVGGCYERTISASGPGAVHANIQESDQQNWMIDDLLFGKEEKKGAKKKATGD